MVSLRQAIGRVTLLAVVVLTLFTFSDDILRFVSPGTGEESLSEECLALQGEMQRQGQVGGARARWEKSGCPRNFELAKENRTSGSTPAAKGSWMEGLKRQVQGELDRERGEQSGRSAGNSSVLRPPAKTRPESAPYTSPFSPEAELRRREELYAALTMELERQDMESKGKTKATKKTVSRGNATAVPQIPSKTKPKPTSIVTDTPTAAPSHDPETLKRCTNMKEKHNVLVGYSWGTLDVAGQKLWKLLGCDGVFLKQPIDAKTDEEWCKHIVKRYDVVPFKTWGKLPFELTDTWRAKACDSYFIAQKSSARTETNCSLFHKPSWMSTIPVKDGASTPLIAIMAASTTRGIKYPSFRSLSLCTFLLASIVRTAECGFRYAFVLGYDEGDSFFDNPKRIKVWLFQLSI